MAKKACPGLFADIFVDHIVCKPEVNLARASFKDAENERGTTSPKDILTLLQALLIWNRKPPVSILRKSLKSLDCY
ncbi:hypothetical protein [Algoriphagus terrigena]|uniref:hypothetical protein n=1 Tax=Algoriphagus terrigena TaxID=344884 RepID=UPI00047C5B73|nr:hypothetical protein [Algoriphagus terrigena]